MKDKKKFLFVLAAILILGGGIFIRFWNLNNIPPGIHYDEAYNGLDAIQANSTGHYKIFYTDNFGREGLHIDAEAVFLKIFGISNWSLRFANAFWGSLTLIGFFFLLRQLKFSKIAQLLGIFMLAFSFWHLDFSRDAYRGIMTPLTIVWVLYFFLKAIKAKKYQYLYLIVSSFLLGLGFYTYIAFRAFPLAMLLISAFSPFAIEHFWKIYWKKSLLYFVISLAVALPILIYFSSHQKDMLGRTEVVSVFDDPAVPWTKSLNTSFATHISAFFVSGDKNPRYNYDSQAILPPVEQILFFAGFTLSLIEIGLTISRFARYRKKKKKNDAAEFSPTKLFNASVIAQSVFWVMILPGILSIEGIPHTLRIIGTIPAVFILLTMPIEYLNRMSEIRKKEIAENKIKSTSNNFFLRYDSKGAAINIKILLSGIIILIVASGLIQVYTYFFVWAKDLRTLGGFEKKLYDLGMLVKELPVHQDNYLITAYNTAISKDGTDSSFKTVQFIAYPKIKNYTYWRPLSGYKNINCADPQIIIFESDQWLRNQYLQACPNLSLKYKIPARGMYGFWIVAH